MNKDRAYHLILPILLIFAGLVSNMAAPRLFMGFNYLPGSIAVLLVLRLYGTGWGLLSGLIAGSWTFMLFGHPYAMIWLTFEPLFIGLALKRTRIRNLVLLNTLYWPLAGIPLLWIFFKFVMHLPFVGTLPAAMMFWVIGITNSLVATIILQVTPLCRIAGKPDEFRTITMQQAIFSIMMALVALPAILVMVINGRAILSRNEDNITERLLTMADSYAQGVDMLMDHLRLLADKGGMETFSAEFLRSAGVSSLWSSGQDGTLVQRYKEPGLSVDPAGLRTGRVIERRAGLPDSAVVVGGIKHGGLLLLKLDHLRSHLTALQKKNIKLWATLLDADGTIIYTNNRKLANSKIYKPLASGDHRAIRNGVYHILPPMPTYITLWRRVQMSWYSLETTAYEALGWRWVLEIPFAPYQKRLLEQQTKALFMLLALFLITLATALRISRRFSQSIIELADKTTGLADRVENDQSLQWPETRLGEVKTLTDNFKGVVSALRARFRQLKLSNDSLAAAREQAEAANAAKSDFLARMSHEIRTPLNAVTGLTGIVLKSDLTAEQRDYLNKVQIASRNLLMVINDILDFSKVEAGRLELVPAPFDLDLVLEQIAEIFTNRVAHKDLELIIVLDPKAPRQLTGDAGRLIQVLTNLIENAVKFTEKGQIVVKVEPEEPGSRGTGQMVLTFAISDTGIGIAADALRTMFEPFTQAGSYLTRTHEGSGLGLAICRRLVELMGGRIWAESIPGQGSTFSFTIATVARREEKFRFKTPADLHGLKVLVADDNGTSRQMMVDLLESFAFSVTAVDSGEKAIAALRRAEGEKPYQLVLVDWQMPGMDGLQTAKAIHSGMDPHPAPIILLATAYGRERVQTHIDTTVDLLMLKPVKASSLFNTIMMLFGRQERVGESTETPIGVNLPAWLAGRRVLVVEDSELNRVVAVAILTEAGITVEIAENGQAAVEKVTGSPIDYYDAVLMDIQMPIIDGYEATRRIRQWQRQQPATGNPEPGTNLPIIALTAHALKGEKEKCLAAGMTDYLAKPIDVQDLFRALLARIAPRQEKNRDNPESLPAQDGPAKETAVLDVDGALKRLAGQRRIYLNALQKSMPEFGQTHELMIRQLASGDTVAAEITAHNVKGTAATIGAVGLNQVAAKLEKAIKDGGPDLEGLLNGFKRELEHTLKAVKGLLEAQNQ
jgi:signal transduction histidine kinase/CheY-like chemotaxis protein/HPt (histidine-containing phosphotransfer) domain-containing protein